MSEKKTSRVDLDRAASVLLDAWMVGDRKAAERWECSERTVQNYRTRMASDPKLAELFAAKKKTNEGDWKSVRRHFLQTAIGKLALLVENATQDQIREVAGAIKIIGDLEVVTEALSPSEAPRVVESERNPTSRGAPPHAGVARSVAGSVVAH